MSGYMSICIEKFQRYLAPPGTFLKPPGKGSPGGTNFFFFNALGDLRTPRAFFVI
jgi:hypothetical protein